MVSDGRRGAGRAHSFSLKPHDDDLAGELSEFGYRETEDPDEADRRRYYKVELWDSTAILGGAILTASCGTSTLS